ncbi:DUF4350 domain-containing protein [Motilibacter deserti]|uniref:DUF4350 domain-containing protein n=1 Tax=Motilibacter deserti TaxID=2714956 RepID=UPI002F2B30AA
MTAAPPGSGSANHLPRPPHGTLLQRARRFRAPAALAVLVLVAGLALALAANGRTGSLDPRAASPEGSKAVATLLGREGVDVRLVRTLDEAVASAAAGDTLLVAQPDLLVEEQARRMAEVPASLVLVEPGQGFLDVVAPSVLEAGQSFDSARDPACPFPTAERAGRAELPGRVYSVRPDSATAATGCYPDASAAGDAVALVRLEPASGARSTTVLGSSRPLTNAGLDEEGNAALALGLLGEHERLVWYLPSPDDVPPGARRALRDLLPDGVEFGAVQIALAVVLAALWRGRRLGPVVPEPLPVVVPAAETVEGRARLYRRAHAADRAADALRTAAAGRLASGLGLPRRAAPPDVVEAVARATGRSPAEVGALLYGPPPGDDAALVRLASDLDRLETEARRT